MSRVQLFHIRWYKGVLPSVAVYWYRLPWCVWPVVMVTWTLLRCDAVFAITDLKLVDQHVWFYKMLQCFPTHPHKTTHHLPCQEGIGSQGCRQDWRRVDPDSDTFWHTQDHFLQHRSLNGWAEVHTELTSALQTRKVLWRVMRSRKGADLPCSHCTSGRCEVVVVEEVRQWGARFRGAAVHCPLLTMAKIKVSYWNLLAGKLSFDVPEDGRVTNQMLLWSA